MIGVNEVEEVLTCDLPSPATSPGVINTTGPPGS